MANSIKIPFLILLSQFQNCLALAHDSTPWLEEPSIKCVDRYGQKHLTFVCRIGGQSDDVKFYDPNNQTFCVENEDRCDHDTYTARDVQCHTTNVICQARHLSSDIFHIFTPADCKNYVVGDEKCRQETNITLIVVPCLIGLIILIGILIVAWKWKLIREKLTRVTIGMLTEQEIREFLHGTSHIDPNDVHSLIHSQPFNYDYEIARQHLNFDECHVLGSGHFGLVMKGSLNFKNGANAEQKVVAVKTLKPTADILYFKALMSEVKIMTYLGKHPNLVEFFGACTTNIRNNEIYVVLEYCHQGDLHSCLKKGRKSFQNLFTETSLGIRLSNYSNATVLSVDEDDTENLNLCTLRLLCWARDISNGMAYLTLKNVIHGDLACRNILICEDYKKAKITDFGLSRQLVNYSNYVQKNAVPLPFKYLAIETLMEMTFSCQSDIWGYGVTCWEIFSLGLSPFPGCEWDTDFVERINQGYRMRKPRFADDEVYSIMMDCWKLEPDERPSFIQIYNRIVKIISRLQGLSVSNDYVDSII